MIDQEYLKHYQPVIFRSFANAINEDHLSHALLLSGEPGLPLKEVAFFLAQSLVCDHRSPLACGHCLNCLRFMDGNYSDFQLIDGSISSIKKENVLTLEEDFSRTAIQKDAKMIYIIHLVENMTSEATNSLLKFLEEPHAGVYAILTTENESKVLPTIVSRTTNMAMIRSDRNSIIEQTHDLDVPLNDAILLADIANEPSMLFNLYQSDIYQLVKENFLSLVKSFSLDSQAAAYVLQKNIATNIKSKEATRLFLDLMITLLEDTIKIKNNKEINFSFLRPEIEKIASNVIHPEKIVKEMVKLRGEIDLSLNLALVFDHLGYYIIKES